MAHMLNAPRLLLAAMIALPILLLPAPAAAQSQLEKTLQEYSSTTVQGYIQPMADLFGANMHAGYFHSARIPNSGFKFAFNIIAMGSMVGDSQKRYAAPSPGWYSAPTFETATIFGEKGSTVSHPNPALGLSYKGSDGIINASIFPLAVPQITLGYLYGTEATVRFMTTPKIGDDQFPQTTLWGVGVRHSISQYITDSPIDIAGSFFFNKFTVGDLISFNGMAFGAQASKQFSILILYAGAQYESSKMNLSYKTNATDLQKLVDIDMDGANKFRFTVGAGLSFGFFHLFADANLGSITNFSAGIGFGG